MRELPDRLGRLPYRLWYEEEEIDEVVAAELQRAGMPRLEGREAVDVDRFVEAHLGTVPDYVELPSGVLGATQFHRDGGFRLQVSARLATRAEVDRGADTLLRSTLAHEAAHALLHRVLFLHETAAIFGAHQVRTELCREVAAAASGYAGEWWEWQANRGMSALLLPAGRLRGFVTAWRRDHPSARGVTALEAAVAEEFRVSRQTARLRLRRLGLA